MKEETKPNSLWIFIAIFASVLSVIVVIRGLKKEKYLEEQIEKNKKDSISLVKKNDAIKKRIKSDSLMELLKEKPYLIDSVPDNVKADYIKNFKEITD